MATIRTPKGDKPTDEVSQREMDRYMAKLSGPLIDRIDIHVEVPPVPFTQLSNQQDGTSSNTMRSDIVNARHTQIKRNGGPLKPNSTLTGRELNQLAPMDGPTPELIRQAMNELNLSARAYDKIRRVSRTIADVEGSEQVQMQHVAEAIQYRLLDRAR